MDEHFRNTLLGVFVVLIVALFVFSVMQANAVREWLNPSKDLHLVLPDEGLFGLSEGAKVEILGTPAGSLSTIIIDPQQKVHALAKIKASMSPFVRRDSKAVIRKTFGVAGEAYLAITRGYGEEMDWDYAVLDAEPDRAPTESIGEIMEDVRSRVIPILQQTERTMTALADLTETLADPKGNLQVMLGDISALTARIEQGQGSLGRMLADDTAAREFEALLGNSNRAVAALGPILERIQTVAEQIATLSHSINTQSKDLPPIRDKVDSILASLDDVMRDLRATSPQLPKITRDIRATTASAPALMGMIQQTLAELETLLSQLRSSWLLGGGAPPPDLDDRLPTREVRP